jgi:hypothetical protein
MVHRAWKFAAIAQNVGKNAVSALGGQSFESLAELPLVVHTVSSLQAALCAPLHDVSRASPGKGIIA